MRVEIPCFDHLPQRIARLGELAHNMWWSWNAESRRLFRKLDRTLWLQTAQNPVQILHEIRQERLAEVARDQNFVDLYDRVIADFDNYMTTSDTWYNRTHQDRIDELIAYFCAEFAVHTSVPIYSGGLGLLAGDTCKEASDLGIPFVAVGAFYPEGYFRQRIAADGSQESHYERLVMDHIPLLRVCTDDGANLIVDIPLDGRTVKVAVWRLQVGRVPIYLMDTDVEENEPWDRDLVARLYGGDSEMRLRQEIVLGIGGTRVLRALGYDPGVFHLNEGHAAFAALELIREGRVQGLSYAEALSTARRKLVFTTHTPVQAGHDEFPFYMMEGHFRHFWEAIGLTREEFLALGTAPGGQTYSMTVLALRMAREANGVSKKHGEVSREMWQHLFPDRSVDQVPIKSITNGVHVPTWASRGLADLLGEHFGRDWRDRYDDPGFWDRITDVPDEEIWSIHRAAKGRLFGFMQDRARKRWMVDGASPGQIVAAGTLLNPEVLTLGFARRFATYKRATLFMRDLERLRRILLNSWFPVQIVFAGKAHPADEPGKFFLKQVYEACSSSQFGGRLAFIDDYDKQIGHRLVQGVDVWLNNPVPPQEASGTSGQKASLNGVPNFSVLDGWWCEGYNGGNGWAIVGDDDDTAAESIYSTLENEIVPLYYKRDEQGIPREWIARMKEAIRSCSAPFSARRMLKEYVDRLYFPG